MTACPICSTEATQKRHGTPYFICGNCQAWFQDPLPDKTYIADFEGDPAVMSDGDKEINRELAQRLFNSVMGGKAGRTLDIGAKLPVFAAALHDLGCEAWAVEHEPVKHDLPVKMISSDFETCEWRDEKFDFISLIHAFEHFYNPVAVISKLLELIAENGAVFIRMPDHNVAGIDRDMTPGHFLIHPWVHTLSSVLQILYETRKTFVVADSWTMDGYGQRDIILRPITKAPTIALGGIVKNEMRDIQRMFDSARGAYDATCLIDTGSSDGTEKFCAEVYLEASDDEGRLNDFSKARNRYLECAGKYDYVLCLDADDELKTPDSIRRASYWQQMDNFGVWIQDGGHKWVTHRFFKTNLGIRFEGRCHEYPNFGATKGAMLDDCLIIHHGEPGTNQEDSNARNLRILMLEWAERKSPRCAFYIANTHRDGGRWKEAAYWYSVRIQMGEHYRDEWLFAHLYAARVLRNISETVLATEALQDALKVVPDWCEFTMELARIAYDDKHYTEAIKLAQTCCDAPIPPTNLWREPGDYRDRPPRLISWCHEHLGNIGLALAWSELASEKIGGPDKEWDDRHKRLRASMMQHPYIRNALPPRIALHRPGAIGDILMTLNLVPLLKAKYPEHQIHYYCAASYVPETALGRIILQAGCDSVYDCALLEGKRNQYEHVFNLIGYPLAEGYPERPMRQHLLRYFAAEMGLTVNGTLPSLSLPMPTIPYQNKERYCTVQQRAGWSKYKELADDKWANILEALVYQEGIPVVQIDEKHGLPLATSIALVANASMHIGVDSFANHLTNYRWDGKRVPGIILWGSTQWDAAGYAENVNISKGIACQPCFRESHPNSLHPREPCINIAPSGVHDCMDRIEVAEVVLAARKLWKETK